MSRMCASIVSRGTAQSASGTPNPNATPALVVASARNPRCCSQRAVPTSQGFGRTKQPDSWSRRNSRRRSSMAGMADVYPAAPAGTTGAARSSPADAQRTSPSP